MLIENIGDANANEFKIRPEFFFSKYKKVQACLNDLFIIEKFYRFIISTIRK